jgi:uncharacterized repeat protein (TIGR01451 family)
MHGLLSKRKHDGGVNCQAQFRKTGVFPEIRLFCTQGVKGTMPAKPDRIRARLPRMKLLLPAITVVGVLILGIGIFFKLHEHSDNKLVYLTHLSPKGIEVASSYGFAPNGDTNKNHKIDAGETLSFSFTVTNKSKQAAKTVTLDTGIPRSMIGYPQNVDGATGILENRPTLIFKNLVILPGETQKLSFTAQSLYSPTNYGIHMRPVLIDPSNTAVVRGESKFVAVTANFTHTPTQVKATKTGGS